MKNWIKTWKNFWGDLWKDLATQEDGMGTVEIILIIVVLVGLVIIFKSQISELVQSIFQKITSQATTI